MFWYGIDLRWAYADLLPSIYRQTYCKHSAYDILHDALIRFALTKNPNREQQPHAYLRTITQNLMLEKYRKESYSQNYQNSLDYEELSVSSLEYLVDLRQRLILLNQIIEDLPARCREVFILFRLEGIKQVHIAEQLNISKSMVERHLVRALIDISAARKQLLDI
jgi:RNA polymerase sigma factor (sigma-70 family)